VGGGGGREITCYNGNEWCHGEQLPQGGKGAERKKQHQRATKKTERGRKSEKLDGVSDKRPAAAHTDGAGSREVISNKQPPVRDAFLGVSGVKKKKNQCEFCNEKLFRNWELDR